MNYKYQIAPFDNHDIKKLFSPKCLQFITDLHIRFNKNRIELLDKRKEIQKKIDSGWIPDFLEETRSIRESKWTILSIPKDLLDRRVEITAPPDKKMIVNALNSGAKTFMADFEDSLSPTWKNIVNGQLYLQLANKRNIDFKDFKSGKEYKLSNKPAVLIIRPRGWHLPEKNFLVNNEKTSASLFDFGIYFYNNYQNLLDRGTAPYFYLPKIENHHEARLWSEVFKFTEKKI